MGRSIIPSLVSSLLLLLVITITTIQSGNARQYPTAFASFRVAQNSVRSSSFSGKKFVVVATSPKRNERSHGNMKSNLNMFMGSDGGILGVGTPELLTILLVGYFVLGPSDLYKITKEVGKFIQNFRTFSAEATASLENTMESQLQLEEIRKAQRELNDAFSFRRSINVNSESEAFSVNAQSPRAETPIPGTVAATAAATTTTTTTTTADGETVAPPPPPKKKIRRRVKKRVAPVAETPLEPEDDPFCVPSSTNNNDATNVAAALNQTNVKANIPDLEAPSFDESLDEREEAVMRSIKQAEEELRKERMERLKNGIKDDDDEALAASKEMASEMGYSDAVVATPQQKQMEQNRFQAQLSGSWNDQIIAKTDELSPLASIMERLALLEEEKLAADSRLEEEFRLRMENEEKYYREKRKLLEDAAAQVQTEAFATTTTTTTATTTTGSANASKKSTNKAAAVNDKNTTTKV